MFLEYLTASEAFAAAVPRLRRSAAVYAPSFFAPYVLAAALQALEAPGWLVVAPDGEAATKLATDLALFLGREVPVLPARGVLYGADVAPAAAPACTCGTSTPARSSTPVTPPHRLPRPPT